jgi:aspartate aminotransferase-like enzyme
MPAARPIVKIATDAWEFDEIHRLNHQTFAEEIPQHARGESRRLVDQFHRENTYVVAIADTRIVGMLAVRSARPFSLDRKLPDIDAFLPPSRDVCELRLLAVDPAHRSSALLPALLAEGWRHIVAQGHDLAIISAYLRQLTLYTHLGFEPFGPVVGAQPDVLFQPMMLTLERFAPRAPRLFRRAATGHDTIGSFLPGPVAVHPEVRRALDGEPRSHRSTTFLDTLDEVRQALRRLTGAPHVDVLLGSGTLANDVIAGQLSLMQGRGLILVNGEFGERLVDHATRTGLHFDVAAEPWGQPFDLGTIAARIHERPNRHWLWFVHCETSTGVLNDLGGLRVICNGAGVRLCVDAISSLGTMAVDLRGVHLASGTSGKGLGAYPGLALVFRDHDVAPAPTRLPRLLDLGLYARDGVPFTHSSNLVAALAAALDRSDWPQRTTTMVDQAAWLRLRLIRLGFDLVGREAAPAPGVVTVALPADLRSVDVAAQLAARGCEIGAFSRHLVERNWIQIALMGADTSRAALSTLSIMLCEVCARAPTRVRSVVAPDRWPPSDQTASATADAGGTAL